MAPRTRFLTRMMRYWRHSGCGKGLANASGELRGAACSSRATSASASLRGLGHKWIVGNDVKTA